MSRNLDVYVNAVINEFRDELKIIVYLNEDGKEVSQDEIIIDTVHLMGDLPLNVYELKDDVERIKVALNTLGGFEL